MTTRTLTRLRQHHDLLRHLAWREITGRYRGSWLGLAWTVLTPLSMLAVYTFVFGVVFVPRLGTGSANSPFDFALSLFAGLIVFNFFAEVINRAPGLIVAHPNYVKKVVFPLYLLPLAAVGAAVFHAAVSSLLLCAVLALLGRLSPWAWALPLAWLPYVLLVQGLAWGLAALGVYLRDIGQIVGMATTALLFLSPVFYPLAALPPALQLWVYLNPLTLPIEATRALLMGGQMPGAGTLLGYTAIACLTASAGALWFAKTEKGFADVL